MHRELIVDICMLKFTILPSKRFSCIFKCLTGNVSASIVIGCLLIVRSMMMDCQQRYNMTPKSDIPIDLLRPLIDQLVNTHSGSKCLWKSGFSEF